MSTEIILGEGLSSEDRPVELGRNPEAVWRIHSETLSSRNAAKLGVTPKEYERELEEILKEDFIRKAKSVEDIPTLFIVETRISLPETLEIVHIGTFIDPQGVEDWLVEGGFETPSKPYVTRLTYIPRKSVKEVRANLREDQRGGTVLDGIAFYLRNPQLLKRYYLNFPGSQVGSEDYPFLFAFSNSAENAVPKPFLSYGYVGSSASPKYACVIASKI